MQSLWNYKNIINNISDYILPTIQMISNYTYAPFKILYDKSYDLIPYYRGNVIERYFPKKSIIEQYNTFFRYPTHIVDNIYLGSAYNAASYYLLKELNIGMIINVTSEIRCYYPDDYTYKQYSILDDNLDSIGKVCEDSYLEIIKFQQESDKNILIHCFMGASRSVSVVANYIMKKMKHKDGSFYNYEDALKFIKEKRDIINPTCKYIEDLSKTN